MKKFNIFKRELSKVCARIASFAMIGTLVCTTFGTSKVEASNYWPSSVVTESSAAIVMEVNTGTILYQKNIHAEHYPASITKILTALVALENSDLDEVVTFSHDAVYKNEGDTSHIARDVGEKMTMEQCLYGMMLESANECAWAIGEHVGGGDINKFVDMMNKKAKELGCKNTHFANPNGLHDADHYTSAYDMALISKAAFQNKDFAKICGTRAYTIPPTNKHEEQTMLNNHHEMLNYYKTNKYLKDYCLGGKTGYTTDAGATLVTFARKGDLTLVCVVMRAPGSSHYTDTINLLDYCFDNFVAYPVSDNTDVFNQATAKLAGSLNLDKNYIKISDTGYVILPKSATFDDVSMSVTTKSSKKDNVVGTIKFTYGNKKVGNADLLFISDGTVPYPFDNVDSDKGGSQYKSFRFDIKTILLLLLIIVAIAAVAYYIYYRSGDILLFKRRKIDVYKKRKPEYKVIKPSRRRKRRRRRW